MPEMTQLALTIQIFTTIKVCSMAQERTPVSSWRLYMLVVITLVFYLAVHHCTDWPTQHFQRKDGPVVLFCVVLHSAHLFAAFGKHEIPIPFPCSATQHVAPGSSQRNKPGPILRHVEGCSGCILTAGPHPSKKLSNRNFKVAVQKFNCLNTLVPIRNTQK